MSLLNKLINKSRVNKAGGVQQTGENLWEKDIHVDSSFEDCKNYIAKHKAYKLQAGASDSYAEFVEGGVTNAMLKSRYLSITLNAAANGTDIHIKTSLEVLTANTALWLTKKL